MADALGQYILIAAFLEAGNKVARGYMF